MCLRLWILSREPCHDLVENSGMIPLLREMAENAIDDPVDLIVFQDAIGIARRRLLSLLLGVHVRRPLRRALPRSATPHAADDG